MVIFKDLAAVDLRKDVLVLNKPCYAGMCLLELSKLLMFDFHYNFMMKKYTPTTCRLLVTDTDSLCYEIKTEDVYKDFYKSDADKFDTSDYPKENEWRSNNNKKVVGKMKDEVAGKIITEFVGLK